MISILIFLPAFLSLACGQYPYQQAPQQPPPQQSYQPAAPSRDVYKPANVHYVNIGAELQGDYKFGYDTGKFNDGQSFREETRLPDGTVQGAYGYVDAAGKQRIVKYTAGKDGFKAEGDVGPDGVPKSAAPGPAPQLVQDPRPQQYAPQPQTYARPASPPAYAPQPSYSPPPQHAPARPPVSYNAQPSYSSPNNEIVENGPRAPIDTSLFNYNIGSSTGNRRY